jgi:hypothetical protein
MQELIGQTAGKIWKTLKDKGSITLADLPKVINDKEAVVFQALGWLARENKIAYQKKGIKTLVSLSPSEKIIH